MSIMKITTQSNPLDTLEAKAEEASTLLGAMANAKRLMVMCNLLEGEKSVGELELYGERRETKREIFAARK